MEVVGMRRGKQIGFRKRIGDIGIWQWREEGVLRLGVVLQVGLPQR